MCNGIAIIAVKQNGEIKVYCDPENGSHDKLLSENVPVEYHNSYIKVEYIFPGELRLDCPDAECRKEALITGLVDEIFPNILRISPKTIEIIAKNMPKIKSWPKELMQYAGLQNADLRSANLQNADLRSANLQNADLRSANLRIADLWNANLRSANLQNADLRSANLQNADLRSANLWNANLQGADLWNANLQGANLWNIRGMAGGSATGLTRSESSFSRDERPKLRQENNNPSGLQSLGTLPFGSLYLNPKEGFR